MRATICNSYSIILKNVEDSSDIKVVGQLQSYALPAFEKAIKQLHLKKNVEIETKVVEWCKWKNIENSAIIKNVNNIFTYYFKDSSKIDQFFVDIRKNQIDLCPGRRIDFVKYFEDKFGKYFNRFFLDMFSKILIEHPNLGKFEILSALFFKNFEKSSDDISGDLLYKKKYKVDVKSGKSHLVGNKTVSPLDDVYNALSGFGFSFLPHTKINGKIKTFCKSQAQHIFNQILENKYSVGDLTKILDSMMLNHRYGTVDAAKILKKTTKFLDFQNIMVALHMFDYAYSGKIDHILFCGNSKLWFSPNIRTMNFSEGLDQCAKNLVTDWSWTYHNQSNSLRVFVNPN